MLEVFLDFFFKKKYEFQLPCYMYYIILERVPTKKPMIIKRKLLIKKNKYEKKNKIKM